jgi:hypothetical protein
LPSRKQQDDKPLKRRRDDGGTGLFDENTAVPSFLYSSSEPSAPSSASSDVEMSEGDEDDAPVREEIDAQEIYGTSHTPHPSSHHSQTLPS